MVLRIEPKIGMIESDGRDQRQERPVFQPQEVEADARQHAVDPADDQLSAHDAGEPAIDAAHQIVEVRAPAGRIQRAHEVEDAVGRDQQIRRDDQREHEVENPA